MSTTQSHLVVSADEHGLRPTFDELCQNTRLLIRLRWVAGSGILVGTLYASAILQIDLATLPLLLIGIIVLSYNALLFWVSRRRKVSVERLQQIAWVQIVLDWLAMTALLHFTGGITSPALIYFVIHAALSGMVLLPRHARALSVLVIALVGGLAALERIGWLHHVEIKELGLDGDLYKNTTFILAVLFFFGTTVVTLSEMVAQKAQILRQREHHISRLYEARSTFVRVATHELRAPLAAGISLMRNLEQGYAGEVSEQQVAVLHRVTSRLEHLRVLIDDLLTFAASQEVSKAQVPLEPVNVLDVLEKAVERETPNAEQKHIQLVRHVAAEPGVIMAGDIGLGIIFGNLLNNAIKYTPDYGCVTVSYNIKHGVRMAEVIISDTGIGIPADAMPHIFNEFFRASNAKSAQINGSGLGLSTVRTLVERYHGTISLESEEGKGTTVRLSFPLAPRTLLS